MYKKLYENLSDYDLIIFDMDGTLYFQTAMRLTMAVRLIRHAFTGKCGIRDLKVILEYRREREAWDSLSEMDDDELFNKVGEKLGIHSEEIAGIVNRWMFENPMDVVRCCRDRKLIRIMDNLLNEGRKVCIYSDYATEDKVDALVLDESLTQYYCGKDDIKTMKPNPSGLFYIMSKYPEIDKSKVILVGDRSDRDKAAADNAGIDSKILPKFKLIREMIL